MEKDQKLPASKFEEANPSKKSVPALLKQAREVVKPVFFEEVLIVEEEIKPEPQALIVEEEFSWPVVPTFMELAYQEDVAESGRQGQIVHPITQEVLAYVSSLGAVTPAEGYCVGLEDSIIKIQPFKSL